MLKFIQFKEIFIKIPDTNIHGTEEIACDFENERKKHTLFHKSYFFDDSLHFLFLLFLVCMSGVCAGQGPDCPCENCYENNPMCYECYCT